MPNAARAVLAVGLSLALTGCGSVGRSGGERRAKSSAAAIARQLPCGSPELPPQANCPGPAPPKPMPISPNGPVRVFKSEYWGPGETDTENGVYEVAATARGTFAVTGIVLDARSPYDPIEGATVTFSSLSGPDLPAPPGGEVRVTTTTGYGGAYAFIDVPAAPGGSCYRMVIAAADVGRNESVDVIEPGVYDDGGIELTAGSEKEPFFAYPIRGQQLPPLYRACAAQASR